MNKVGEPYDNEPCCDLGRIVTYRVSFVSFDCQVTEAFKLHVAAAFPRHVILQHIGH